MSEQQKGLIIEGFVLGLVIGIVIGWLIFG
jgi:high-affinity Fe2+/Pb2+ permease